MTPESEVLSPGRCSPWPWPVVELWNQWHAGGSRDTGWSLRGLPPWRQIRTREDLPPVRRPVRNDGAIHRAVPGIRRGLRLGSEFCLAVFPSPVQDASGPHDNTGRNQKAGAGGDLHSSRSRGPAGLDDSSPPNAPPPRFARDSRVTSVPA